MQTIKREVRGYQRTVNLDTPAAVRRRNEWIPGCFGAVLRERGATNPIRRRPRGRPKAPAYK
jgi:hypothetical protein